MIFMVQTGRHHRDTQPYSRVRHVSAVVSIRYELPAVKRTKANGLEATQLLQHMHQQVKN